MEKNPVLVLLDLCGHFEEGEDHSGGLGRRQGGVGEGVRAEGLVQDRGATRQEEPHGVGQEGRCRGVVAVEVTLDRFAIVFAIAPRTVQVCIRRVGVSAPLKTSRQSADCRQPP